MGGFFFVDDYSRLCHITNVCSTQKIKEPPQKKKRATEPSLTHNNSFIIALSVSFFFYIYIYCVGGRIIYKSNVSNVYEGCGEKPHER